MLQNIGPARAISDERVSTIREDIIPAHAISGGREGLPAEATVPAIALHALCKTFGRIKAVDNLTLTIQQGEIFGLLGPNGSGKTTTINLLCGLSAPTSGTVRVLGYELPRHARQVRRLLGCVPQETALFEDLTAQHNMEYHAALYHVPHPVRKERIATLLDLMHLSDRRKHLVKTFSGGMKRRLALARALLHEPPRPLRPHPRATRARGHGAADHQRHA